MKPKRRRTLLALFLIVVIAAATANVAGAQYYGQQYGSPATSPPGTPLRETDMERLRIMAQVHVPGTATTSREAVERTMLTLLERARLLLVELVGELNRQIAVRRGLGWTTGEVAGASTTTPATDPGFSSFARFDVDLASGATGGDIVFLQRVLATDPGIYPEGIISGVFGDATRHAVNRFQQVFGIAQTGVLDAPTRATLNNLLAQRGIARRDAVPTGLLQELSATVKTQRDILLSGGVIAMRRIADGTQTISGRIMLPDPCRTLTATVRVEPALPGVQQNDLARIILETHAGEGSCVAVLKEATFEVTFSAAHNADVAVVLDNVRRSVSFFDVLVAPPLIGAAS